MSGQPSDAAQEWEWVAAAEMDKRRAAEARAEAAERLILEEQKCTRFFNDKRVAAEARVAALEEALRDFEKHGVRHDLNPTRKVPTPDSFWLTYIAGIDKAVRDRARAALRVEGDEG